MVELFLIRLVNMINHYAEIYVQKDVDNVTREIPHYLLASVVEKVFYEVVFHAATPDSFNGYAGNIQTNRLKLHLKCIH